jgi:hypothetical protein
MTVKFSVTMKDPDALYEAVREAQEGEKQRLIDGGLSDDEAEQVAESRCEKAREFAGDWMKYGEYITVEFDTEAKTATLRKDE